MTQDTWIVTARKYLSADALEEALLLLQRYLTERPHRDETVLLLARYQAMRRHARLQIVSDTQTASELTQLRLATLELLSEAEKSHSITASVSQSYNLPRIKALLEAAFDDTGLMEFCLFYFADVFNNFGEGQSRQQKTLKLLDYIRRHEKFDFLLERMKENYPTQFERFAPYY